MLGSLVNLRLEKYQLILPKCYNLDTNTFSSPKTDKIFIIFQDLLDVEHKHLTDEQEDQFTADWVKIQMDEEAWRKLTEKERQLLLDLVLIST